jgi:hypothetical protein
MSDSYTVSKEKVDEDNKRTVYEIVEITQWKVDLFERCEKNWPDFFGNLKREHPEVNKEMFKKRNILEIISK